MSIGVKSPSSSSRSSADPGILVAALVACPEAVAVVQAGKILWCNHAHARLFGYNSSAELLGHPLAELLPHSYPCTQAVRKKEAALPACGFPACQFLGRCKDGSQCQMESSCSEFRLNGRQLLVLTTRDISQAERRRVAREGEARFRAIFEAAAIGIGHFTLDGKIVESNRALERMLGYSHQELQGMPFALITHTDDLAQDARQFAEMAAGRRDQYQLEKRFLNKGGEVVWARLNVSLVRGPGGEPQFAIKMVEDITERKRAEEALRESQKLEAVGRLVAGLAHDFANLLTGIGILSDLLVVELESHPGARRAREIRLAVEHGCALIRKLLFISRQQVSDCKVLSLETVVEGMRNLLAELVEESIELEIGSAPQLGHVKADPAEMQQLILNLVVNARDAMPQGGRIRIELGNCTLEEAGAAVASLPAGEYVFLEISDTGCGMDENTRAHLFEPFFTTKPPGQGTGLGLATVKAIVTEAHGGIAVESAPGRGTRMRVLLPRVEAALEWRGPEAHNQPSLEGRETVLLVEDDERVRASIEQVLTQCGYRLLVTANGEEAVRLARQYSDPIHLLLVDMVMPGKNGREVVEQIAPLYPLARVLFISGYGPESGGDERDIRVFRKPFAGGALARKVREVLDTELKPAPPARADKGGQTENGGKQRRRSC